MQQHVTFVEKDSKKKFANDKNYQKVRDHCHFTFKYRGAVLSIWNLRFNAPDKIHVVFHNGENKLSFYHKRSSRWV